MLHADTQQRASPGLSVSHSPAILMEQGSENRETFYLQESRNLKRKKCIYKASAKHASSARALLPAFSLCLLKVAHGVSPELQQTNTTYVSVHSI